MSRGNAKSVWRKAVILAADHSPVDHITYAHLWPDSEDRARSVVEEAMVKVTGLDHDRPADRPSTAL